MNTETRLLLLDEVRSHRPSRLRSVETRVTKCGGEQIFEKKSSSGAFLTHSLSSDPFAKRQWYAGDYRPDLQVGVVLPGLIIGAQDVAQDLSRLRKLGVSHILNVATGVPNCFPGDFTYKRLSIRDHPDMNIRRYFEECFKFIDQGRSQGWVFVHCNAGISRAATICIGYLMSRQDMRYETAINKVREVRPIISPNYGFTRQLKEFDKELFGTT